LPAQIKYIVSDAAELINTNRDNYNHTKNMKHENNLKNLKYYNGYYPY